MLAGRLANIFSLTVIFSLVAIAASEPINSEEASIVEDGYLSLPDLVRKYGYSVETHIIQTEDGYLLTVYRIPDSKKCTSLGVRKPVLIQHGLLSSAYDFLIMGPKKSLGYLLADNCYDVWLGNNRGNSQSRGHVNLTVKDPAFWKFTWHEMGRYDIPAMVDFILNVTKLSKLHYIGFSQGTTQFFVFSSLLPEYQNKIESMQALSPVAYLKFLSSPFIKVLSFFHKINDRLASLVGLHEFLPQSEFLNFLGQSICHDQFPVLQNICANVIFLICGFDEPQLNVTLLPAILGHVPAGASTKQFVHFAQSVTNGGFRHFDFGAHKNMKKYGSIIPPSYNLTSINIPISLYYGKNDWLSDIKDVQKLKMELPNVVSDYEVPYTKFNHLDSVFGTDAKFLLYDKLIEILGKYR